MSEEAHKIARDMANVVAPLLPPPAGDVVRFLGVALDLALDLFKNGLDPIREIERIREAKSYLNEAEASWEAELGKKA